ncbi:hypothetical protein RHSIM_Rhsim13G0159500 [Rhododendron simsii]|uniref:Gnk2-homologous domain-containing protein n=1 Tax=Rhododendron simsii TaxID=118357 RepID=A0A834FXB6_RHOSS|nr:hypothetical protein RHSIM_Rhsim13G0159500 [Rhododendron simsii]
MGKFLRKIPRKALFVYTVCLLSLIPIIKGADPTFVAIDCPKTSLARTSTYAPNSTYHTNLNTLFSALSSNNASNGFYNFTAGSSPPDVVYGLFLCRGDVTAAGCRDCVAYASGDVVKRCPRSKEVTVWYEQCLLRYSYKSIFNYPDTREWFILENTPLNVTDGNHFNEVLGQVMGDIANRASKSDDSGKKFATAQANYSALQPVYGLAECTPDLSDVDCYNCLRNAISKLPEAKHGGRVLFRSCYVRYEMYSFYNASFGAAPPPPLPVLPPPSTTTPTSPVELLAKQESLETAGIFDNLLQIKGIVLYAITTVVAMPTASIALHVYSTLPHVVAVFIATDSYSSVSSSVSLDILLCGYMSPEYVMRGQFSAKSDVFSFGVLILEIISGKKNNKFSNSAGTTNLLSYAWKLWREGTPLDLMDPTLQGSYSVNEVTRCIHIALLCVQDDPNARPSMATIVLMLNSYSATLSRPQQPGFLGRSRTGSNIPTEVESDQSTSKSIQWSPNEVSTTEIDPR